MEENYARLTRSGVTALTLGIVSVVFGLAAGVLGIVTGAKLFARPGAACRSENPFDRDPLRRVHGREGSRPEKCYPEVHDPGKNDPP